VGRPQRIPTPAHRTRGSRTVAEVLAGQGFLSLSCPCRAPTRVTPDAPRNASLPVPRPCDGPLPRRGRVVRAGIAPGLVETIGSRLLGSPTRCSGGHRICARLWRRSEPASARRDRPGRRDTYRSTRTADPLIKRRHAACHYPTSIRPSCDARAATPQRILATQSAARPAPRDASDPQRTPRSASGLQAADWQSPNRRSALLPAGTSCPRGGDQPADGFTDRINLGKPNLSEMNPVEAHT